MAAGLSSVGLLGYSVLNDGDANGKTPPKDETPTRTPEPTPTEQRTFSGPGVLDVRDFGAMGDGKTDDSAAIQAALNAASKGDTVLLPETEDSYLLSYEGTGREAAIELDDEHDYSGITLEGERPERNAQVLQVDPGTYDSSEINWIIKLNGNQVYKDLTFRNLTLDGGRPKNDKPAGLGGEASLIGVHLVSGEANGGHDILFENVEVRQTSASAFRFNQSGVTCRNVTAFRAGRHGFNPVADDTEVDPGFVGYNIKAVGCDGTGIDHRGGTARLENVYTAFNRSGNKWKHLVRRLEVVNHHSYRDMNHGWRSNHSSEADDETPPEVQEIIFDRVFIEEPGFDGVRISGTDTKVRFDLKDLEVRRTSVQNERAAISLLRDVEPLKRGSGHIIVVDTEGGKGLYVGSESSLDIKTLTHWNNEGGAYEVHNEGSFRYENIIGLDPGENFFETPRSWEVGAFTGDVRLSNLSDRPWASE